MIEFFLSARAHRLADIALTVRSIRSARRLMTVAPPVTRSG
jgi:hypothetical protein